MTKKSKCRSEDSRMRGIRVRRLVDWWHGQLGLLRVDGMSALAAGIADGTLAANERLWTTSDGRVGRQILPTTECVRKAGSRSASLDQVFLTFNSCPLVEMMPSKLAVIKPKETWTAQDVAMVLFQHPASCPSGKEKFAVVLHRPEAPMLQVAQALRVAVEPHELLHHTGLFQTDLPKVLAAASRVIYIVSSAIELVEISRELLLAYNSGLPVKVLLTSQVLHSVLCRNTLSTFFNYGLQVPEGWDQGSATHRQLRSFYQHALVDAMQTLVKYAKSHTSLVWEDIFEYASLLQAYGCMLAIVLQLPKALENLEKCRKILGDRSLSEELAQTTQTIGEVLVMQGRYKEAEVELRRAVEMRASLGFSCQQGAIGIGELMIQVGRLNAANLWFRKVKDQVVDSSDLSVQDQVLLGVAKLYIESGDYLKAEILLSSRLDKAKDCPPQPRAELELHYRLALAALGRGSFTVAQNEMRFCLTRGGLLYGPRHPWTLLAVAIQARILFQQRYFREAIVVCQGIASTLTTAVREDHPTVASILVLGGQSFAELGNLKQALAMYNVAHNMLIKSVNRSHPELARCRLYMALVAVKMGQHSTAEALLDQARDAFLRNENHFDKTLVLTARAWLLAAQNQPEKAMVFASMALSKQRSLLGESHPHLGDTYLLIGFVKLKRNQVLASIESISTTLALWKQSTINPLDIEKVQILLESLQQYRAACEKNKAGGRGCNMSDSSWDICSMDDFVERPEENSSPPIYFRPIEES